MHRRLIVVADDYGIGPATSAGILRLCRQGDVSGTVLLVNSPFAADAVEMWQRYYINADLGWHPCLTIDAPTSPRDEVRSLTTWNGRFPKLGQLVGWLSLGRCRPSEIVAEFRSQLLRFREMTGHWPAVVNSHHHIQVFPIVGAALRWVLREAGIRPYLRRVYEPWHALRKIPGGRFKRAFLSSLGGPESRRQADDGFPGAQALAGITNPTCVHSPEFFEQWLSAVPGECVELTCHPGEYDETLYGRDAAHGDGNVERRIKEMELLTSERFAQALIRNNFRLIRPSELIGDHSMQRKAA